MKEVKLIIIISMAFISITIAQEQERELISSMGSDTTVGKYTIISSVGESVIHTTEQSNYKLTQGFQQPNVDISTVLIKIKNTENTILFPNPARDNISIVSKINEIAHIDLYTIKGEWIMRKDVESNKYLLGLENIQNGEYFLKLSYSGNGSFEWLKFIAIK